MAETEVAATPAATPKKAKAAKPKKPKTSQHPKVSEMVNTAISTLKERGGSSVQAIKKYVGAHYKVDVDKLSPFIKKYLKNAVASGTLVQTKGKGASGSFRMTSQPKEKAAKPKSAAPKAKKAAKPAAKKAAKPKSPKKAAVAKKPKAAAAKKPKAAAAKSPKKAKAAKPKKAKPAKKPAAKKSKK